MPTIVTMRNEATARIWVRNLEKALTTVAAWTAGNVSADSESEWEALHRIAMLHNSAEGVTREWCSNLSAHNLHFGCAVLRLLPTAGDVVEVGVHDERIRQETCCSACAAHVFPEPPGLLRQCVAASVAARNLPTDEGSMDPNKRYLVRYMLRTLLANKKWPSKEVLP